MRLLISLVLMIGLSACSQTYYREMQTAADDMSALKTFSWETTATTGSKIQDTFDTAFRDSMSAHLQNKGYTEVGDNADMTVDYRISVIPAEAIPASDNTAGLGWRLDDAGQPIYEAWDHPAGMTELYQRGLLILTVTRSSDKSIVWQAGIARVVDGEGEIDKLKMHASRSARKLARSLPKQK
ncbi:MAG: DUF4136 domain-containing protein [Cellvibrionaceae bacterium]